MNEIVWTSELRFAVALALGFLIGLERETAGAERKTGYFAGVRTHTIICLFGYGTAWLHRIGIELALPAGMAAVTALAVGGYIGKLRDGRLGVTSELAALLTYIIGVLTVVADVWVAMALAITGTILLSEKADLEEFVDRLERSEFLALVKFLLVTVIVLPILPDKEYFSFKLNPARIWQVVIMVSGIGFVGYYLTKKFGSKLGLWLSGMIGGMASSTAVTITMARIAKNDPAKSGITLQASILASSVLYMRTIVLIWFINPAYVSHVFWKFVFLSVAGMATIVGIRSGNSGKNDSPVSTVNNPFELRPAIMFASLFIGLSALTILVRQFMGSAGLIGLSLLAGLTDITPLIMSLVQQQGPIEHLFISAIILAAMSNTIVKGVYFVAISKQLKRDTALRFGIWAALHIPLAFFF